MEESSLRFLRCYMIAQCKHAAQSGGKAKEIAFRFTRLVVFNKNTFSKVFCKILSGNNVKKKNRKFEQFPRKFWS